jgi:hypothetical protein
MKPSELRCINCHSSRRNVYHAKLCAKCYYWHRKASQQLKHPGETKRRPATDYRMSVAERVLQEYAWRERHLNVPDVDPLVIEWLVYAVAAECRSEIRFPIHSLLTNQSAEARRCLYSPFLAILENTPCSLPRLRMTIPPRKGEYWDGWPNGASNVGVPPPTSDQTMQPTA